MTNAELFKQTFGRYATDVWSLPEDEFLEWLNADVQQKTGRWIADVDRWGDIVTTVNGYRCSKCDNFNTDRDNYCPYCGAKMEVRNVRNDEN